MNIFRKNNILISGLISDSFDYLQRTYNQSRNVFTVASAWGQILFVIQNLSQLILYFIEDSITELNISEATRDSSVRSLARIAGYDPGRANTAQGEVSLRWNLKASDTGGGAVIIKDKTRIRCTQNGLIYSLIVNSEKVKIPLTAIPGKKFKFAQGVFQSSTFTGTGRLLQSFNASSKAGSNIDQFFVDVYINNEKWEKYDSLYDIPLNGNGYLIRQGISNGIDIYFGNVNFGKIPQAGSIINVQYLETVGFSGNLRSSKENPILFTFMDSGLDLFNNEVNLNDYIKIETVVDPSFGTDPESIDLIRLVAPKTSRSFVFANSDNYEIFLERLGVFSQVSAFSTFDDDNLDDDNVVYIYLVPNVTLNLESNEDYFDLEVSDFTLSNSEREQIYNLLEDSGSMIATTVVKILEPTISRYIGNAIITIFEGYDEGVIKDNIKSSISDYFINLKRRDRVPKSDIIAIIESVSGVDSVSFFFVGQKNEAYHTTINGLTNVSNNQASELVGMNQYGDIIIGRDELILLRGGFTDRNGVKYSEGIIEDNPCSLNISITEIIPKSYTSERSSQERTKLIAGNN